MMHCFKHHKTSSLSRWAEEEEDGTSAPMTKMASSVVLSQQFLLSDGRMVIGSIVKNVQNVNQNLFFYDSRFFPMWDRYLI